MTRTIKKIIDTLKYAHRLLVCTSCGASIKPHEKYRFLIVDGKVSRLHYPACEPAHIRY